MGKICAKIYETSTNLMEEFKKYDPGSFNLQVEKTDCNPSSQRAKERFHTWSSVKPSRSTTLESLMLRFMI